MFKFFFLEQNNVSFSFEESIKRKVQCILAIVFPLETQSLENIALFLNQYSEILQIAEGITWSGLLFSEHL